MTDLQQATPTLWKQIWDAITGLFKQNQQVITLLRTPTPVKISQVFQIDPSGCIGGGLSSPDPRTIYQCPISAEAWLNRITITSPEHTPVNPMTTGEVIGMGSTAGEVIFFLPQQGSIAPVQIVEGRLSAPHLNPGEQLWVIGDQLPAGMHLRFDIQLMLVTGISEFTPPDFAPGKIAADEEILA